MAGSDKWEVFPHSVHTSVLNSCCRVLGAFMGSNSKQAIARKGGNILRAFPYKCTLPDPGIPELQTAEARRVILL